MDLHIITTGGTIDKVYFDALSEFQVGDPQIGEVLRQAHVCFRSHVTALFRKDSLELTDSDRALLKLTIENDPTERVVVTHGTDTMAITGRFLKQIKNRTIVLTGSLSPIRFRESDALFNIGFAVASAQLMPPGVYLAMNGMIYDPELTEKDRQNNRFISAKPSL